MYAKSFEELVVYQKAKTVSKAICVLIDKADAFCHAPENVVREDAAEYYVAR